MLFYADYMQPFYADLKILYIVRIKICKEIVDLIISISNIKFYMLISFYLVITIN
jgi:hypothetical protein